MNRAKSLSLPKESDYVITIEEFDIRSTQEKIDNVQVMDYEVTGQIQKLRK